MRPTSAGAPRHLLVAGCGDLGTRVALRRLEAGERVTGIRRGEAGLPQGICSLQVDLHDRAGLRILPSDIDAVLFCATPDRRDADAYRRIYRDAQLRLLDALRQAPRRWIFVSSTAVYGDAQGAEGDGWVDETTFPQPDRFNGEELLQAETALREALPEAIVLRLAGIYGPGRAMLARRAAAGEIGEQRWTNRIHVDDAAAATDLLLDLPQPGHLYLGADGAPSLQSETLAGLRALMGIQAPAAEAAGFAPSDPELSGGGRRIRPAALLAAGWRPTYADYRSGYAEGCGGMLRTLAEAAIVV